MAFNTKVTCKVVTIQSWKNKCWGWYKDKWDMVEHTWEA